MKPIIKQFFIAWPVILTVFIGVLITGLVYNLVGFSKKISEYYTPFILASDNFLEATSLLKTSLENKSYKIADNDVAFIHFKNSLIKFREVVDSEDNVKSMIRHESDLFNLGNDIISNIESGDISTSLKQLSGLNRISEKHYVEHTRELTFAQLKIKIVTVTIAGICVFILVSGIVISFREHKLQEAEKNEAAVLSAIQSLINALDARDAYTKGHSTRVVQYSIAVASELGMSKKDIEILELSALMHDIGKIGISDIILLKEGRLTDEEFSKIKEHPDLGAKILKGAEGLSRLIPGILYHHERFDGKGYPAGLKRNAIPLSAQCIAIADTFDAMTSSRPYRKALSFSTALDEIRKNRGTQWSEDVVDAFFRVINGPEIISDNVGIPESQRIEL